VTPKQLLASNVFHGFGLCLWQCRAVDGTNFPVIHFSVHGKHDGANFKSAHYSIRKLHPF